MFSKKEREYLKAIEKLGSLTAVEFNPNYAYVLKHRIKRKAFHAIQDLKLLASLWYWFESSPRGPQFESKGTSLEKLVYQLEEEFRYLSE